MKKINQKDTQINKDVQIRNWCEMLDHLSSLSVPDNRTFDVCAYVAGIMEGGIHIAKEDVPDEISELFNDTFTFDVLNSMIDQVRGRVLYEHLDENW